MARTRITNRNTQGVVTLPLPYGNLLAPGGGVVVTDDAATVISNLGGPAVVVACGLGVDALASTESATPSPPQDDPVLGGDLSGTASAATVLKLNGNNLNSAGARSALGLGTSATHPATDFAQIASNLSDLASSSAARINIGAAADIKVKHGLAIVVANIGGCSHQKTNAGAATIAGYTQLDPGDSLATAGARYLAVRTIALAHFASVGTASVDGDHQTADTTNGAGMGTNISTLGNLITRIDEMKVALVAHASQGGVHFANDAVLAALTLTVDPPVTQANCNADINDLAHALMVHLEASVEQVYA